MLFTEVHRLCEPCPRHARLVIPPASLHDADKDSYKNEELKLITSVHRPYDSYSDDEGSSPEYSS